MARTKGKFIDKALFTVHGNGDGSGKLNLFALTFPLFFERIGANLIGLVQTSLSSYYADGFFVLVTAVPNQIVSFASAILGLVSAGLGILLSIYIGSGRKEDCKRVMGAAFWLTIALSTVIGVVCFTAAREFLVLMGMGTEEYAGRISYATAYLRWRIVAVAVPYAYTVFSRALHCYGHPRVTLVATLASNGASAFATYLGMFVFCIPPEHIVTFMGLVNIGSALLTAGIVIGAFLAKRIGFSFKTDFKHCLSIVRYGFPAAVADIAYSFSQTVTGGFCVGLGTESYVARQYTSQIVYFGHALGYSMGNAGALMVGRAVGMEEKEFADRMHRQNLRIVVLLNFVFALLLAALARPLLFLVYNADETILGIAQVVFLIDIVVEVGRGMNHVGQFELNAVGDVRFTTVVSVFACFACSIGLSALAVFVLHWGLAGMWAAFAIDELFRGTLYFFRWRGGKWKDRKFD